MSKKVCRNCILHSQTHILLLWEHQKEYGYLRMTNSLFEVITTKSAKIVLRHVAGGAGMRIQDAN